MLQPKTTITLTNGQNARVLQLLGQGGQGAVYSVDLNGKKMALKWYTHPAYTTNANFYHNLETNIRISSPSPTFLWPSQPIPPTLSTDKAEGRIQKLILAIGAQTMPRRQIIAYLGLKQRSRRNFMDNYLRPAIAQGYVVLAYPNSPNKPEQAYRLSANGLQRWAQLTTTNMQ